MAVAFVAGALAVATAQVIWIMSARALASDDSPRVIEPRPRPAYINPVLDTDFPDPFVLRVDGENRYVAFSTNSDAGRIPMARSGDGIQWRRAGDAMPQRPAWTADIGRFWAPTVANRDDEWRLFFTGPDSNSGRQCIGLAVAARVDGPYQPEPEPFICQAELGGSIDPEIFDRRGDSWLLWKNDGNCCGLESWIWSQPLAPDGLHLQGEARRLLTVDRPWERDPLDQQRTTIEGPFMVKHGDQLYLFYSANGWATANYAIGWATCATPQGPCTKHPEPLLTTNDVVAGPGGASIFTDQDSQLSIAYHAWRPGLVGPDVGWRALFIDRLLFRDGTPVVDSAGTPP